MKKIFLLCFFAIPIFSFSQTANKNEIGIGVGSIEYSTSSSLTENLKWMNSTPFSSSYLLPIKFLLVGGGPDTYFNAVTPEIYYSRTLSKKMSIFLSYQFINIYGYDKNIPINFDGPEILAYSIAAKLHKINLGLNYTFLSLVHLQMYAGTAIGSTLGKIREDGYEYGATDFGSIINDKFDYNKFAFSLRLTPNIGIKLILCKNYSLKYEIGGVLDTDRDFLLSPLNRLSINYDF